MACSINLFNALSSSGPPISNTGTWYFIGYNATSASGPWTWVSGMPSGLPPITPPTNGWMGGYNQSLNFTGVSALGFYKFQYITGNGDCTDVAELIVEAKPNAFPGLTSTRYICPGYASGSWSTYFNSGVGTGSPQLGTLSLTPPVSGGITGSDINPSVFTPGSYALQNSLTVTPTYSTSYPNGGSAICPSCSYGTFNAISTIIVQPDPSAPIIDSCVPAPSGDWTTINIGTLTTTAPGNTNGKWYISSYNGGGGKAWRINGIYRGFISAGSPSGAMWDNTSVYNNTFEVAFWDPSDPPITLTYVQGTSFLGNTGFIGGTCMLSSNHSFDISTGGTLEAHLFTDMGNATDQMDWRINKFWTNATINNQTGATEWVGASPINLGIYNYTTVNGLPYITNMRDALNSIAVPGFTFAVPTDFTNFTPAGASIPWTARVKVTTTNVGNWVYEWENVTNNHRFRVAHTNGVITNYFFFSGNWVPFTLFVGYTAQSLVQSYDAC